MKSEYGYKLLIIDWYRYDKEAILSDEKHVKIGRLTEKSVPVFSISKLFLHQRTDGGFSFYFHLDVTTAQSSNSKERMGFSAGVGGFKFYFPTILNTDFFLNLNAGVFDMFVCNDEVVAENSDLNCVEVDAYPTFDYGGGLYWGNLDGMGVEYAYNAYNVSKIISKNEDYSFDVIQHKVSFIIHF
ncbi:MAG: hypothetical protein GY866_29675 [Proteobacteria bacterium]|nr:hypothetical protein [Pseudomonadota bacterium]